ncbi:hypothetical protein [Oricola sp.]|nr:hypothetical protein [Oricola sp.]
MILIRSFGHVLATMRGLVWRQYHPERHYMRGPGPACAKRQMRG